MCWGGTPRGFRKDLAPRSPGNKTYSGNRHHQSPPTLLKNTTNRNRTFSRTFRPHNHYSIVIFFFPYNRHPAPIPTKTPGRPTPENLISVHFRSVSAPFRVRLTPFGSVSGLLRVRFGSVSGCWVGSGWGRGEGLS